ncbi:MAG: GTP-binding protein [Bacteroidales bacterium]|nr:GTP-binding protein [Bacteroidales bacterium]
MNHQNTPVLLLTGYLGSGKTTLVNRILTNRKGIKFAVVVNDIGEVNIDADLIQKGGIVGQKDDSLVALQNGCICCTLKMDLVEQLNEIMALKRFDYIVIEASGICEPGPIAQTICSIPQMGAQYTKNGIPELDCIVTVVDALRLRDEFGSGSKLLGQNLGEEDLENLVIQQIEFCNIILLNKASEVSADELGRIRQIIKTIQPKAEIINCDYGDVDFDKILNTNMFDFDKVATSAAWIDEIENHHDDDDDDDDDDHDHEHCHCHEHDDDDDDHDHEHCHCHEHEHEHDHDDHDHEHCHCHHHHHHHDGGEVEEYGIGTFVYYRREPFNLGRFDEFVARKWPKNVIRAKGVCYFEDEYDMCYLFEQAGRQVGIRNVGQWYATMPKHELDTMMMQSEGLRRDWDETYGDRMQKIVFIGQHLDKKAIAEELDKCLR